MFRAGRMMRPEFALCKAAPGKRTFYEFTNGRQQSDQRSVVSGIACLYCCVSNDFFQLAIAVCTGTKKLTTDS